MDALLKFIMVVMAIIAILAFMLIVFIIIHLFVAAPHASPTTSGILSSGMSLMTPLFIVVHEVRKAAH